MKTKLKRQTIWNTIHHPLSRINHQNNENEKKYKKKNNNNNKEKKKKRKTISFGFVTKRNEWERQMFHLNFRNQKEQILKIQWMSCPYYVSK